MVKRFSVIMDGRFNNLLSGEENRPGTESPSSGRITTTSSLKKSRRSVQKRVVSVPIGDMDGSRLKGDGTPPADSWAWRKYGQKPIKGSPYPRGYYRCSSSKGCPARKQVERSRLDPTMLVITYACEHNHPFPASKNGPNSTGATHKFRPVESAILSSQSVIEPEDEKFADLGEELLLNSDDIRWFPDVASTILDSPICGDSDLAMIFPMREEDESLFADLGELPECSVVFRRNFLEVEEESRRCNSRTAAWCESTG